EHINKRALKLAELSDHPIGANGMTLTPLKKTMDNNKLNYEYVDMQPNQAARTATITVRAPESADEQTVEKALEAGPNWWPLQMARELDDAILSLRTNELEVGLWVMKTAGNAGAVLAMDKFLLSHQNNWFIRE